MHPTRHATITIYNGNNQQVAQAQGLLTYNQTAMNMQGNISVGNIAIGSYIAIIKMDGFLGTQFPNIISITSSNQTITLPSVSLVTGNINTDNQLDLTDYNALISCFGSKFGTSSCQYPNTADMNDDGAVDGTDYNLFLRELSTQKGG